MYEEYSTSTYKTSIIPVSISTTYGKVVNYTNTKIRVKCTEKTLITSYSTYSGKDVNRSYYIYYKTIFKD